MRQKISPKFHAKTVWKTENFIRNANFTLLGRRADYYESYSPRNIFEFWSNFVPPNFFGEIDERQITHLICARLEYDLYDFFRGCFWAFHTRKKKEAGPKHPLKKSYRSYFRRAQIR